MGGADWTARALLDLQRQLDRVAVSNPVAADRLSGEVKRVVALFADQPGLGFRGHRPEVRIALTRRLRYRIVDQPTPGGVTIPRILHPRQSGP